VFELLDEDGSSNISANEFEGFSFLFNFEGRAVSQIFNEFDVSGKQVSTEIQVIGRGLRFGSGTFSSGCLEPSKLDYYCELCNSLCLSGGKLRPRARCRL
jgi:hypothetical protein